MAGLAPAFAVRADPSPADRLKEVQKNAAESQDEHDRLAKQAAALAAEIEAARRDSIAAAAAAQQDEAALSALEDQLRTLGAEEAAKQAELAQREKDRAALMMALVRLARRPPEALAFAAPDPVAAERSALVLGQAVPALDRAAKELSANLKQLAALRIATADAEKHRRVKRQALAEQQARLNDLIARKSALQQQAAQGAQASAQKIAELGQEAASLKDLIDKLEAERKRHEAAAAARAAAKAAAEAKAAAMAKAAAVAEQAKPEGDETKSPPLEAAATLTPPDPSKPAKIRDFSEARGKFLIPASGRIVAGFGQSDGGIESKGMTFETRAGAQVVAPFDGRVLFAGPFRGYGQILIIEHSAGYHSLLAGLERIEAGVGQWLVAGEPVGTMPQDEDKPRLYLELRQDGQPINPLPWLATSSEKVSG